MAEKKDGKKGNSRFSIYWIYGFIGLAFIGFSLFSNSSGNIPVKYESTFIELAEKG